MELFITFKNRDSKNVVDMPSSHAGLNNVRAVREIEGCRIPLKRFGTHIWSERTSEFRFGISEEEAAMLNLCNERYDEEIFVAENELNNLFYVRHCLEKDKETNEIKEVLFKYQINREKALEFITKKLEEEENEDF